MRLLLYVECSSSCTIVFLSWLEAALSFDCWYWEIAKSLIKYRKQAAITQFFRLKFWKSTFAVNQYLPYRLRMFHQVRFTFFANVRERTLFLLNKQEEWLWYCQNQFFNLEISSLPGFDMIISRSPRKNDS